MKTGFRVSMLLVGLCVWATDRRSSAFADEPREPAPNRWLVSTGVAGAFDEERNAMVSVELRGGVAYAGIHPWLGAAWATDGGTFIGAGALYTLGEDRAWQTTVGFGPGYYERNEGRDLGKHLEFLSFLELSRAIRRGHRIVLRLAHISNGSLSDHNPGTELLTVGYMLPLARDAKVDRR